MEKKKRIKKYSNYSCTNRTKLQNCTSKLDISCQSASYSLDLSQCKLSCGYCICNFKSLRLISNTIIPKTFFLFVYYFSEDILSYAEIKSAIQSTTNDEKIFFFERSLLFFHFISTRWRCCIFSIYCISRENYHSYRHVMIYFSMFFTQFQQSHLKYITMLIK